MSTTDPAVALLIAHADRLDELADTAALMDDSPTAAGLHAQAVRCRAQAMALLDAPPHPPAGR